MTGFCRKCNTKLKWVNFGHVIIVKNFQRLNIFVDKLHCRFYKGSKYASQVHQ